MIFKRGESFIKKIDILNKRKVFSKYNSDILKGLNDKFTKFSKEFISYICIFDISNIVSFKNLLLSLLYKDLLLFGKTEEETNKIISDLINKSYDFLIEYYIFSVLNFKNDIYFVFDDCNNSDILTIDELSKESENIIKINKFYFNQYINIILGWTINQTDFYLNEKSKILNTSIELVNQLNLINWSLIKEGKEYRLIGNRKSPNLDLYQKWIENRLFKFGKIGYEFNLGKKFMVFQEFSIKLDKNGKVIEN